jgi:predicted nuclease with TOPRIM domain
VSIRLSSFRYLPKATGGWETPKLDFGALFTVLEGPNGSGKTPIMEGLYLALGHGLELPPAITDHCSAAQVTLVRDSQPITITRFLDSAFRCQIEDEDGARFITQAEYARWFTKLLGGEFRTLTNKHDKAAELYANVVIPAFAVDQDHGWSTDYYVPRGRDFLKNQRQEVIRFLMGLQPRHPFRTRTDYEEAKVTADKVDREVDLQRYAVDRLRISGEFRENEEPELLTRRAQLQAELNANSQTIEAIRDLTSFVERDVARLESERDALRSKASSLSRQKGQLSLVLSELDGEIEILGANVDATEILRHFCGRAECALFANSAQSYGRSLLYLKDQMKDLRTSADDLSRSEASVAEKVTSLEQAIAQKNAERNARVASSPQAQLMTKLDVLTKDVVAIELRLANLHQYVAERAKFERLLDRRTQAHEAVEALKPKGQRGDVGSAEEVRQQLAESMQQWLQILRTQNVSAVAFDEDFVVQIDGGKFAADTHHGGSTRARIVLAFHAALLDVALTRGGNHPGWLLLDAPRQHELDQEDFNAYADRLKMLGDRYPGRVQIVFSVANLKTQIEVTDELWVPHFTNDKNEPRFLGPPAK